VDRARIGMIIVGPARAASEPTQSPTHTWGPCGSGGMSGDEHHPIVGAGSDKIV